MDRSFFQHLPQEIDIVWDEPRDDFDFYQKASKYDGIVCRTRQIRSEPFKRTGIGKLKCIARAGAGLDDIDVDFFEKKGVSVLRVPEGNQDSLAEHTMAMLLAIMHRLLPAHESLRQERWEREKHRGMELKNKNVGIIGYGYMGSAFARRLRSFGCRILAYDKYKEGYAPRYVEELNLKTLLEQAQIISLHVPLSPETHHMVDEVFLRTWRNPLVLLNTSRGKVVHMVHLKEAMEGENLFAAGLDVFPKEPPIQLSLQEKNAFKYLCGHPRVLLSPHVAGWSSESWIRTSRFLERKLKKFFQNLKTMEKI
ncbi:MAG: NAD(P)-binding domain-containing protein [Cytophagales bacterium]|nr:NAD(P)-binding domain-containing protein [Cytophagales bacterium]